MPLSQIARGGERRPSGVRALMNSVRWWTCAKPKIRGVVKTIRLGLVFASRKSGMVRARKTTSSLIGAMTRFR